MGEIKEITLIKPLPKRRTHTRESAHFDISKEEKDSLGGGHEGPGVERVTIPKGEKRQVNLAYKEYYSEGQGIGVPVPTTFRLVEHDGKYTGIAMTDLTRGWRDILITTNETKVHTVDMVFATHPETVRKMVAVDLKNEEWQAGIQEQLELISEITAQNRVEFSAHDVASAVFNEDGKVKVVISDMGSVFLESKKPYKELKQINLAALGTIKLMIGEAHRLCRDIVKWSKKKDESTISG